MKIAKRNPFSGAPVLHTPTLFGATTGEGFLYRIPVTGERPITVSVSGLPEGLTCTDGILSGVVRRDCEVLLTISAENACGKAEGKMRLRVAPATVQLTPLLGFTTWNAYTTHVNQACVLQTAEALISSGIADYGYGYVNVDSGWQEKYGGPYNAIQPNFRFPDMKAMVDRLHTLGFRAGIYSTPMLTAWGCPPELSSIPGCTVGERDERFPDTANGGIGKIRREAENVRQWCDWGFDYLKYDWAPTDGYNAHLMKQALLASCRTFTYCITVIADIKDADTIAADTSSWRDNGDSQPSWGNIKARLDTIMKWADYVSPGHFYDLDMLAIGIHHADPDNTALTEAEKVFAYTMRAFFCSPIQISAPIETLTEFELDLFCNDDILALNQDALAAYPQTVSGDFPDGIRVYSRALENGDTALAVFSLADTETEVTVPLSGSFLVRNLWEKVDLGTVDTLSLRAEPHAAYVYRLKKR